MHDGDIAHIGHNQGPAVDPETIAGFETKTAEFMDACGAWLDKGAIENRAQAEGLNDFISGAKALRKKIEAARKKDKEPFDRGAKAVQEAYRPIIDKLDAATKRVSVLLTRWLEAEERRRQEEARRAQEEARRAQEEADRLARQAESRNDVAGEVDAEAARKEAERLAKEAERLAKAKANVGSATGGGRTASFRTIKTARVVQMHTAFLAFKDHPELKATLERLATAAIRAKDGPSEIAGFKIITERKAV